MKLRDTTGTILQLDDHVEVQFIQYSKNKLVLFNSGFIIEIDPNRPRVVIETTRANDKFDINGKYAGTSNVLNFCHFTKSDIGLWIAYQIEGKVNRGTPLFLKKHGSYVPI